MIYTADTLKKQFREEKDDWRQKADQCIFETADGESVWYVVYAGNQKFRVYDLVTKRFLRKDQSALLVNYRSPRVGYVNMHDGTTRFLVREPVRRWTIGLTINNTKIYGGEDDDGGPLSHQGEWKNLLIHSDIGKNILNKFPSFQEALYLVTNQKAKSRAFNRNFIVKNVNGIVYVENLQETIGNIVPSTDTIVLKKKYDTPIMHDQLKEAGAL